MTTHEHDPLCRAVNFDPDTGSYTGRRAFDDDNCKTCRAESPARAHSDGRHASTHPADRQHWIAVGCKDCAQLLPGESA